MTLSVVRREYGGLRKLRKEKRVLGEIALLSQAAVYIFFVETYFDPSRYHFVDVDLAVAKVASAASPMQDALAVSDHYHYELESVLIHYEGDCLLIRMIEDRQSLTKSLSSSLSGIDEPVLLKQCYDSFQPFFRYNEE